MKKWAVGFLVLYLLFGGGSTLGDQLTDAATDTLGNATRDAVETGIEGTADVAAGAVKGTVGGVAGAVTEHRIDPVPTPGWGPFDISPIPRSPSEIFPGCRIFTFC